MDELELFTIEMALDYIEEYVEFNYSPKKKNKVKATQSDFDSF